MPNIRVKENEPFEVAIRRFCRSFDVLTGLGEFVEQDI